MKKSDFAQWALTTQSNFTFYNGTLRWFGFDFWMLEKCIIKPLVDEFKNNFGNEKQ